jgi:hypothetical protein
MNEKCVECKPHHNNSGENRHTETVVYLKTQDTTEFHYIPEHQAHTFFIQIYAFGVIGKNYA